MSNINRILNSVLGILLLLNVKTHIFLYLFLSLKLALSFSLYFSLNFARSLSLKINIFVSVNKQASILLLEIFSVCEDCRLKWKKINFVFDPRMGLPFGKCILNRVLFYFSICCTYSRLFAPH